MTPALVLALAVAAGPEVRVGSKAFTESIVLGELVTRAAASAGTRAEHRRALGGTRVLWEALLRGEIDLYPEYTGTLAREILAGEALPDDEALRRALAARGVGATASLGFEDTYALGMRRADAARLGVRTISEIGANDPKTAAREGPNTAGAGGIQIAEVSVDMETGVVKLAKLVAGQHSHATSSESQYFRGWRCSGTILNSRSLTFLLGQS